MKNDNETICVNHKDAYYVYLFELLCSENELSCRFEYNHDTLCDIYEKRLFARGPIEITQKVKKEWQSLNHDNLRKSFREILEAELLRVRT